MKPPIFMWMSGTLDAFDSIEELEDRYPRDTLADGDFVACDSEGRILMAGRASDGLAALACDDHKPPSPDTLRRILQGYLERSGITAEQLTLLTLAELIARAYPDAPGVGQLSRQVGAMHYAHFVLGVGVALTGMAIFILAAFVRALARADFSIKAIVEIASAFFVICAIALFTKWSFHHAFGKPPSDESESLDAFLAPNPVVSWLLIILIPLAFWIPILGPIIGWIGIRRARWVTMPDWVAGLLACLFFFVLP